jgi:exopolyphosphatase / guanosine-5'-triphosphate,3'-diphosphate pyrophosphatase
MFAAVDLGSNSFRLHIGHHDGETIRVIKSAREPIRLAAGLDAKGNLTEAAMQSAISALAGFRTLLQAYELDSVRVVATNTLRIARNAGAFLPAAEKAIGAPIEIISGEEEGRLIYMGVASTLALPAERRLVIDIGGGSTELILGKGQEIERVESFSIGTVKQSLSFFPGGRIDAGSFEAAILSARSHFEDAAPPYHPQHWTNAYGSSGTIRAIADAIDKNGLGDGSLSYKSLVALRTRLIQFGHTSRIDLIGMKPDRAVVIVGGLAILMALMQELGIKVVNPVEAGLRMGVLWDLQWRATKRDRREQSVRSFAQRFHADELRGNRVADVAAAVYGQLKPTTDALSKLLCWSGMLHEIGLAVSHSGYHKHGAYLMENADLPGFTTREQRSMSMLILGQKGNLRKLGDLLGDLDFAKAVLALRLSVMLMHSRIDSTGDDFGIKMKNRIELDIRRDWGVDHPTVSYWLEKEREWWNEVNVEFLIRAA